MIAFKGFNKDMTCRGFQYKEGETYETDEAIMCEKGFHACLNPINCFALYSPDCSVYHEVEIDVSHGVYTGPSPKVVGKKIKIGKSISVEDMISISFKIAKKQATQAIQNEGNFSAYVLSDDSFASVGSISSVNASEFSEIITGYGSVINAGTHSYLKSDSNSVLRSGSNSILISKHFSVLHGGNESILKAGGHSTLRGGMRCVLIGGIRSSCYAGLCGRVKAGLDSMIAIEYFDENDKLQIAVAHVDGEKIKPDTWYIANDKGEIVEF